MRIRPVRPACLATLVLLAAAVGVCGCTTRVKPTPSKAVLEARAHKNVATEIELCGELTSPVSIGFGFGDGELSELAVPAVDQARQALACHPDAAAVIVGQADGHGTDQEQAKLAADRAKAVAEALQGRGIDPSRLKTQILGSAPKGDATHLLILAEGRRW